LQRYASKLKSVKVIVSEKHLLKKRYKSRKTVTAINHRENGLSNQTDQNLNTMRTNFFYTLSAIAIAVAFSSCASQSHIYVAERPAPPVVMRSAPPFRGAVWIPEEYVWRGGRYVYVAPHYVRAPHRGHTWVAGYWNTHRGRSVWVKGHWRRWKR